MCKRNSSVKIGDSAFENAQIKTLNGLSYDQISNDQLLQDALCSSAFLSTHVASTAAVSAYVYNIAAGSKVG